MLVSRLKGLFRGWTVHITWNCMKIRLNHSMQQKFSAERCPKISQNLISWLFYTPRGWFLNTTRLNFWDFGKNMDKTRQNLEETQSTIHIATKPWSTHKKIGIWFFGAIDGHHRPTQASMDRVAPVVAFRRCLMTKRAIFHLPAFGVKLALN